MNEELDIETIEKEWIFEYWDDTVGGQKVITKLVEEIKRLREDRAACLKGLKELKDNAIKLMRSYPQHSEGWFDFSRRAQAYENAYIRTTNMLNWNGSGMSFVHFKEPPLDNL